MKAIRICVLLMMIVTASKGKHISLKNVYQLRSFDDSLDFENDNDETLTRVERTLTEYEQNSDDSVHLKRGLETVNKTQLEEAVFKSNQENVTQKNVILQTTDHSVSTEQIIGNGQMAAGPVPPMSSNMNANLPAPNQAEFNNFNFGMINRVSSEEDSSEEDSSEESGRHGRGLDFDNNNDETVTREEHTLVEYEDIDQSPNGSSNLKGGLDTVNQTNIDEEVLNSIHENGGVVLPENGTQNNNVPPIPSEQASDNGQIVATPSSLSGNLNENLPATTTQAEFNNFNFGTFDRDSSEENSSQENLSEESTRHCRGLTVHQYYKLDGICTDCQSLHGRPEIYTLCRYLVHPEVTYNLLCLPVSLLFTHFSLLWVKASNNK